ncbi:MAG: hypothetical protein PUE64_11305 [Firmicutes bacterium]|nr:hypothetical protein [Bacillota bacterium]
MNRRELEHSGNRKEKRKNIAGNRTVAAVLAGLALSMGLTGCGSHSASSSAGTTAETAAEVSTSLSTQEAAAEETTQAPAAETTEAAAEETTEQAETSSSAESDIDYTPLTDGLSDMAGKYSQGAFAGISFQSAVTAAKMLDWYVTKKPSDVDVVDCVKSYLSENGTDTELLQNGLEIVYSAAQDTLTDTGALETGGWNQGVTWNGDDIDALFGDICDGAGIPMPSDPSD